MKLTPKNWRAFQHYKLRRPPWIRLHRSLLDNYEFQRLHVASRALAPMLWLLASEYERGEIDAPEEVIAFRLRISVAEFLAALKPLVDKGFFQCASAVLAACVQHADSESESETETEDSETETEPLSLRSNGCVAPPAAASPPPAVAFIAIPTVHAGVEVPIFESEVIDYEQTYPAVDVRQELRAMRRWSIDNPTHRKTAKGIRRFVNSWLSKEQNRGRAAGNGHGGASPPMSRQRQATDNMLKGMMEAVQSVQQSNRH